MLQPSSLAAYTRVIGTVAGTTVIADRPCGLFRICFNQNKTGTATFYDCATAAGTTTANTMLITNNNVGSLPMNLDVGCRTRYGLTTVVGGTVDFTVIWN
jgi:hypothetical protein